MLVGFCFSIAASSQPLCGFDTKMKELKSSDPDYARQLEKTEEYIRNFIASHPENARKPKTVYTIPVVVHVMHTGGAVGTIYNPTDAQIIGAIDYLNQIYGGTYAGMQEPVEGGGVVNMELQFVLAKRTPSCGSTNGIERIDASSLPSYVAKGVNSSNSDGTPDYILKDFARWDPTEYYNIWVVNKIDGKDGTVGQFTAGFAYFAGAPARLDGTIMLATQMKTGQKTLPHEIGHAFNLYHVFEGSNISTVCPTNTDCTANGDGVCDTDPVSKNANGSGVIDFTCRTGTNTCTGTNYTKNTENNFMGYTYCYTLFTNGQKARVQAAMTLPGRASLFTSPGLTPCGQPEINFSLATSAVMESSGGVDGCRKYTDHTYSMTIGQAPTDAAMVTLSFGGTATKGLDYEVTTNGNFASPGNVLTFGAGSTAPQEFTVRVYDDADVDPGETAILNFTLTTTGNAEKGTTIPTFTLTINDYDQPPVAAGAANFGVGTASVYIGEPFKSTDQKKRGQFLYKVSELRAAGMTPGSINSMQIYIYTKNTTGNFNNFSISLGKSDADYLVDAVIIPGTDFTTVFTTPALSTVAGWNLFTFTTPYVWDGVSNIVVEYCYSSTTGLNADNLLCYKDGGSASQSNFMFKSGIDCATSFSSVTYYGTGVKPIIQFGSDITGTEVETTMAGTQTEFIAVGSNNYFYSSGGKILANVRNLDADPGCVQVTVESAGTAWQPLEAGNRSAKVFQITPTANGTTTSYNLSLYFTAAELDGRDETKIRIAKTSAATMNDVNAANTEIVTPTVTSLGSNWVFTADFTGFSRFFLVDELVALPINLISFTGKLNDRSEGELHWEVGDQRNFSGFDVERSNDGQTFKAIQNIPAKQGSGTSIAYGFTDRNLAEGVNYYRLKMMDNDGHFSYSKIVKIIYSNANRFVTLTSNPVKDVIKIEVNNKDQLRLGAELYNAVGARVGTWQLGPQSGTVALPIGQFGLSSGMYLLVVSDGNKIATLKVQKQ